MRSPQKKNVKKGKKEDCGMGKRVFFCFHPTMQNNALYEPSYGEFSWSFWRAAGSTFLERAYFAGRSVSRQTCSSPHFGSSSTPNLHTYLRNVSPPISVNSTGSQPGEPSSRSRDFLFRRASGLGRICNSRSRSVPPVLLLLEDSPSAC